MLFDADLRPHSQTALAAMLATKRMQRELRGRLRDQLPLLQELGARALAGTFDPLSLTAAELRLFEAALSYLAIDLTIEQTEADITAGQTARRN